MYDNLAQATEKSYYREQAEKEAYAQIRACQQNTLGAGIAGAGYSTGANGLLTTPKAIELTQQRLNEINEHFNHQLDRLYKFNNRVLGMQAETCSDVSKGVPVQDGQFHSVAVSIGQLGEKVHEFSRLLNRLEELA